MPDDSVTLRAPITDGPSFIGLEHAFFSESGQKQVLFHLSLRTKHQGASPHAAVVIRSLTRKSSTDWKFTGFATDLNMCSAGRSAKWRICGSYSSRTRKGSATLQLSRQDAVWVGIVLTGETEEPLTLPSS